MSLVESKCSDHPLAPHGFDRNSSHTLDRYVCECEGWQPPGGIENPTTEQLVELAFRAGFDCGFRATGEGFNGEYPGDVDPLTDESTVVDLERGLQDFLGR